MLKMILDHKASFLYLLDIEIKAEIRLFFVHIREQQIVHKSIYMCSGVHGPTTHLIY